MTTIKQVLDWPLGQKGGGWTWTVKTAKKAWEDAGTWYQYVMFAQGHDEILGSVTLQGNVRIQPNARIKIIVGWRDEADINNKTRPCFAVDEWEDDKPKMTEPEETDPWNRTQEEWDAHNDKIVRGKCRYGIVCAIRRKYALQDGELAPEEKRIINSDVDFIMTGK